MILNFGLIFTEYLEKVLGKCNKAIAIIRKFQSVMSKVSLTIYKSLVYPDLATVM